MFPIQTHFAGRPVTREAFLAWENHCIDAASKRLGTHVPDGAVHLRRETFLEQKLRPRRHGDRQAAQTRH
ncbi:MAG: hypothetical protein V9G04_18540 [Nocardioides sp.]